MAWNIEVIDQCAVVRMNTNKVNVQNDQFFADLHHAFDRLEREFNQTVITTVPNVSFLAYTTKGEKVTVNNPVEFPDPVKTERIEEPFIKAQIITKPEYIGNIMTLCLGKRGILVN